MIETLYNDFTTKLLPKIQEGLVITKDYFLDLFGRYVKYLIITDSILLGLMILLSITGVIFIYKGIKYGNKKNWNGGVEIPLIMFGIFMTIFGIGFSVDSAMSLVKDIYIPEIRVIEQLKSFNQ